VSSCAFWTTSGARPYYRGRAPTDLATVTLTVTTAALETAIGLRAIHFPEKFHLEGWRVLTAECDRREAGQPARPIVLARQRFDDLPPNVKAALHGDTARP